MRMLVAVFMLVASAPANAASQRPGPLADWELLGTRRVSFAAEKDVIVAKHQGRFRAIKIEVDGGNLEMYEVKIVFGNGERFAPQTRFDFREGSWSRTIDLPGDARVIRRIEFLYRSELRRGRAQIRVWGRE